MTEEQLNSTFYDIGAWLGENFATEEAYLSLASKVERRSSSNYMVYGGVTATALAIVAVLATQNRKKEEKSEKLGQMQSSFI